MVYCDCRASKIRPIFFLQCGRYAHVLVDESSRATVLNLFVCLNGWKLSNNAEQMLCHALKKYTVNFIQILIAKLNLLLK